MCYNFLQNENDCGDFSACMDRSKSCNGKNYIKISLTKKKEKKNQTHLQKSFRPFPGQISISRKFLGSNKYFRSFQELPKFPGQLDTVIKSLNIFIRIKINSSRLSHALLIV